MFPVGPGAIPGFRDPRTPLEIHAPPREGRATLSHVPLRRTCNLGRIQAATNKKYLLHVPEKHNVTMMQSKSENPPACVSYKIATAC